VTVKTFEEENPPYSSLLRGITYAFTNPLSSTGEGIRLGRLFFSPTRPLPNPLLMRREKK